jgi:hypothetical protein
MQTQLRKSVYRVVAVMTFLPILIGCRGGPQCFRSTGALRPAPDSWFPFFERHHASDERNFLRLKVVGYVHHLSLVFDEIEITNLGDASVSLCASCAHWFLNNDFSGPLQLVPAGGDECYQNDAFCIRPHSSMKLQGIGRFERLGQVEKGQIRLEIQLQDAEGKEVCLQCYFDRP